jgi:chitinase
VLDKVSSPCLDAGDPNSDYSDEPIPNGGRINLGAYGGTAYASLSEGGWMANEPPHVVITAPADGMEFSSSQTIEIRAEAWDVDGVVVGVEFFADGEKIGEDADESDGWMVEWTMALSGSHEIVARATDNDGAATDSAAVTIHRRMPRRR